MAIMSEINSSKDRKSGVKKKDKDPERSSKFENSPQGKAALRSGFGWCEEAGQVLGDVKKRVRFWVMWMDWQLDRWAGFDCFWAQLF